MGYLSRLSENLKDMGFSGQLLVLGPSGVLGIEAVKEKPLYQPLVRTGGRRGRCRLPGRALRN